MEWISSLCSIDKLSLPSNAIWYFERKNINASLRKVISISNYKYCSQLLRGTVHWLEFALVRRLMQFCRAYLRKEWGGGILWGGVALIPLGFSLLVLFISLLLSGGAVYRVQSSNPLLGYTPHAALRFKRAYSKVAGTWKFSSHVTGVQSVASWTHTVREIFMHYTRLQRFARLKIIIK